MNTRKLFLIVIFSSLIISKSNTLFSQQKTAGSFNIGKDLLLAHYDCKTDVDDLHSVAGLATILSNPKYSKINYHAVAGAFGIQEGLYVPPNELFQLAFGDNWTDAHENFTRAVKKVKKLIIKTLAKDGDIWIAEAGQSDFSAELIKKVILELPELNVSERIHIVQHSDWNEEVTSPEKLEFVKQNADYHKIPDGNVVGNGTPGFSSSNFKEWNNYLTKPELIEIWKVATELANKYNGQEGRYTNKPILAGGLDFSDLAEVCWILGLQDIKDSEHFFNLFSN